MWSRRFCVCRPFKFLCCTDAYVGPFLVNDVCQDRKFLALFYLMILPIIGKLISRLLPGHPPLDPLVAPPQAFPRVPRSFQTLRRIGHLLHPLVSYLCKPAFKWFSVGRRN